MTAVVWKSIKKFSAGAQQSCAAYQFARKKQITNKLVNRYNCCCGFGVSLAALGEEVFNGVPTAAYNLQRRAVNWIFVEMYARDFLQVDHLGRY